MNRARASSVAPRPVRLDTDPDVIAAYVRDAAHSPGGMALAVARPATVDEVVWLVQQATTVLPVGAQSSLTGGATPAGDIVLSTARFNALTIGESTVRVGAGVTLRDLQDALAQRGSWFPPVPTFLGATVGGAIATNAAGAATFKYGPVRRWVRALTMVLASGDVLTLRRGEVTASADGAFTLDTSTGGAVVHAPAIRMPDVPKCSAGYFAAPGMDLIDLFIGSEGTLGIVVEAELEVQPRPPGTCWVVAALADEAQAIALVADLRRQDVLDVAAIEHLDERSIALLREDGTDRRLGVEIPADAAVLLLIQVELTDAEVADGISDDASAWLADRLAASGAVESAAIVMPSEHRRRAALIELREAVPAAVNRRVGLAHAVDSRIHKTAADMIVPFDRFAAMMSDCRRLCAEQGLDLAVWGHISDGNVHPNVIPRNYEEVERGRAVIVELATRVIAMGGSPLAEHGVGRNRVKQQLLRLLYGDAGVASMRAVKQSLDPEWKLAPGVLFERYR